MPSAVRKVVVPNDQGLHARPISLIAETAASFQAELRIVADGREVDGRSILQLMTLCASKGSELILRAEGPDAEPLVDAVARLVESGFGE